MKTDVEIVLSGEKDHIIMIVSPIRGNMCFSPSYTALFYFEPSRYDTLDWNGNAKKRIFITISLHATSLIDTILEEGK